MGATSKIILFITNKLIYQILAWHYIVGPPNQLFLPK